jgi:hypothetical protein
MPLPLPDFSHDDDASRKRKSPEAGKEDIPSKRRPRTWFVSNWEYLQYTLYCRNSMAVMVASDYSHIDIRVFEGLFAFVLNRYAEGFRYPWLMLGRE